VPIHPHKYKENHPQGLKAKKLGPFKSGLNRLRKNALYEGHGFSRAVRSHSNEGFSP
jgi:hypothetical protein